MKALAPGSGAYGFLTSPQGRILSDVVVLALEDRLWMEVGPGQEGPLADHLKKYILADRVEVRPLADMLPVSLTGPGAAAILGARASRRGLGTHAPQGAGDRREAPARRTGGRRGTTPCGSRPPRRRT